MIENRASRTAERVALRRAAHQLLDDPLVLDDPIALAMVGADAAAALRADPQQFERGPYAIPLRAFLAVRSRVAEDTLARTFARGARQYVVLGAGFDTFAFRNPFPDLRVIEVDHPATQAAKRERLAAAGIALPHSLTFAATDFSTRSLPDVLQTAGLRAEEPAFFSWLGVTPYLDEATVMATLAAIAPFASGGGGVVFDYSAPRASLSPRQQAAFDALAARVAAAGEPFKSSFEPEALISAVRALGFASVHDLTAADLNAAFFANRRDDLRVGGTGRILVAL